MAPLSLLPKTTAPQSVGRLVVKAMKTAIGLGCMSVGWIIPIRQVIDPAPQCFNRVNPSPYSLERRQGLQGKNNPKLVLILGFPMLSTVVH